MTFAKRWKTNWELKSLSQKDLFDVIVQIITKQLDDLEKEDVKLESNFVIDKSPPPSVSTDPSK